MNYYICMSRKNNRKSTFNKRLAQLRKAAGLTQHQLAEGLGVSRDIVAYYETKAKNPTTETVQMIADFFRVPCEQLLSDRDTAGKRRPGPVSKLERQFEMVRGLPSEEQKFISQFLDRMLVKG